MAKITLKQLKKMIRESVKEQISGLPQGVGAQRKGAGTSVKRQQGGGNPWLEAGMSLDQLVAAMKKEQDPQQEKLIKQAISAKLKAAGW